MLVKVFFRGQLVKVHPRQPPGGRSTDADDLPSEKTVYAMRDLDRLQAMAAADGPAVGTYARALLDIPWPWPGMRQVYAPLGLVKKWGLNLVPCHWRRPGCMRLGSDTRKVSGPRSTTWPALRPG